MKNDPRDIFRTGYMTTRQLMCQGVPFSRIDGWLKEGSVEKADRGVYCLPGTKRDEFALIQYRYDRCIFSGITALSVHGLTDHISESYHVTFPQGYNPSSLNDCPWNLLITRSVPKVYGLGMTRIKTAVGNEINVYDKERSLCDILRGKGMPPFIVKTAMKRYFHSDERDEAKLMEYARILHVADRIDRYLDIYG